MGKSVKSVLKQGKYFFLNKKFMINQKSKQKIYRKNANKMISSEKFKQISTHLKNGSVYPQSFGPPSSQVVPVQIIWKLNQLDTCLLLAKFQNRNYLGTCFTCKQNMQFCKQNMVISLIFGLLKVHSSTNKYFYEKRILYMKSAHSN